MNGLLYLKKKLFINGIKTKLKKPTNWLLGVFVIAYLIFMFFQFYSMAKGFGLNRIDRFSTVLIIGQLYLGIPGYLSYCQKKGLVFTKPEINFTFNTPINPKLLLIMAALKGVLLANLFLILILIIGYLIVQKYLWLFILYGIVYFILNTLLELSIVILTYGNEYLSDDFFKKLNYFGKGLLVVVTLILAFHLYQKGFNIDNVLLFFKFPFIKLIPIFGWAIAFIQLIFVEYSLINLVGSVLYVLLAIILPFLAYKSKCTGEFFEDAESFSNDFELAKKAAQEGGIGIVGKRKSYKKALIEYKGNYAKAIYYRQLLVYKKQRFFIFSMRTFVFFIAGLALLAGSIFLPKIFLGINKNFILPGMIIYYFVFFSGFSSKYQQELKNAYIYLIPDSAFNKTWYATVLEHISVLIDVGIFVILGGIALRLNPLYLVFLILLAVLINGIKLYLNMVVDAFYGLKESSISLISNLIKFIVTMLAFGSMFLVFLISYQFFNYLIAFILTFIWSLCLIFISFYGSIRVFENIESVD